MPDIITALSSAGDQMSIFEELQREYLADRVIVFNNEVTDDMVEDVIMWILRWNKEDKDLPVDKRKKIKLYISSVGGDSFVARNVVDVILASKTPIIGIGLSLVASAAYHLYLACHERVAFKNTIFLQHDGSISISNSSKKAQDTFEFIKSFDEMTKEFVLERTRMTEEFYDRIFDSEYYMIADKAKELGIVEKIIGEDCSIDDYL